MTGVVFAVLDRRAKSGIAYMAQTQEEKIVSRIQDVFRGLAANEARLLFAGSLQSVLVSKRHRIVFKGRPGRLVSRKNHWGRFSNAPALDHSQIDLFRAFR